MLIPVRFNLSPFLAASAISLLANQHYIASHGFLRGLAVSAVIGAVAEVCTRVSTKILGTALGLTSAGLIGLGGGYFAGKYVADRYYVPFASKVERELRQTFPYKSGRVSADKAGRTYRIGRALYAVPSNPPVG